MKRLINDIKNFFYSIDKDIEKKKWLKVFFKTILTILIGTSMFVVTIWGITLIAQHLIQIIFIVGITAYGIALIRSMLPKNDNPKENTLHEQTTSLQYDPITLENTYKLLRTGLCSVIGEIFEVIYVKKPVSYTQMDAPIHYDIVANVPIYHLLVAKTGKEIDTYMVLGILQNSIEQKLNNNEFNGITQAVFFYNGRAYPSIMVDKVLDCGNMIQIDIAVASEYYCKYREMRIYNNMNGSGPGNNHDKDF